MLLLLLHYNDNQYFVTFYQKIPSNTKTLIDFIANIIVFLLITKQQYQQVAPGIILYRFTWSLHMITRNKKRMKPVSSNVAEQHAVQYDDNIWYWMISS